LLVNHLKTGWRSSPRTLPSVDLLLLDAPQAPGEPRAVPPWARSVGSVPFETHAIDRAIGSSSADFVLLWRSGEPFPAPAAIEALRAVGADFVHGAMPAPETLAELDLVLHDWSLIVPSPDRPASSWRLGPDACLMRTGAFRALGGFDLAFRDPRAAALDLGFRALRGGALVEYRPELGTRPAAGSPLPRGDVYAFLLRHYGTGWARYVGLRHVLSQPWRALPEHRAFREAQRSCRARSHALQALAALGPHLDDRPLERLRDEAVSVVLPTLGRPDYVVQALDSLARQTVPPNEVIVVDQNPPEARQPALYASYARLGLTVLWQDQTGQALARNAAIEAARGPWVFLFDDDSVAAPDLIEKHLRAVVGGRYHVSTGVSYSPGGSSDELPELFRYPRLAQTLDTGNSLMSLRWARSVGGIDRAYDHGPGADGDLGTRLYLAGARLLHNPRASRTHFKAPSGGLRTHGVHKYNTDAGVLAPFPPPTQVYYQLRFLSPRQARERVLLQFVTSKLPRVARRLGWRTLPWVAARLLLGSLVLPLKYVRSVRRARALLARSSRPPEIALGAPTPP